MDKKNFAALIAALALGAAGGAGLKPDASFAAPPGTKARLLAAPTEVSSGVVAILRTEDCPTTALVATDGGPIATDAGQFASVCVPGLRLTVNACAPEVDSDGKEVTTVRADCSTESALLTEEELVAGRNAMKFAVDKWATLRGFTPTP